MKKILPIIIALIIVGGVSFYGGIKYGQSKNPTRGNFSNLTTEQRQRFQQMAGGRQTNANFVNGQVIAKDENSITVKLNDAGSKIIFVASSTKVTKTTEGTLADLEIGKTVMVNSKANEDGSLTAQLIQIRSEMPPLEMPQPNLNE